MSVDATAPRPGMSKPSLPVAGAIVRAVVMAQNYGIAKVLAKLLKVSFSDDQTLESEPAVMTIADRQP